MSASTAPRPSTLTVIAGGITPDRVRLQGEQVVISGDPGTRVALLGAGRTRPEQVAALRASLAAAVAELDAVLAGEWRDATEVSA